MTFLDVVRSALSENAAQQLGQHVGLGSDHAAQAVQALLPLQLDALSEHAQTLSGAQQVLDLAASVPNGSVDELLARPNAYAELEQQGASLSPLLLGQHASTISGKLAEVTSAPEGSLSRLGHLTLPLLLNLLSHYTRQHHVSAAGLGGMLEQLRPTLRSFLPAALVPLIGGLGAATTMAVPTVTETLRPDPVPVTAPVSTVKAEAAPQVIVAEPIVTQPVVTETVVTEERRRGAGWLWALPLALLLLLGGCYLANRNRTETTTTTTQPGDANSVVVTEPSSGSTIPAAAFTMKGSGKAGDTLNILDSGQQVGTATVGSDGTWSADLPAPTTGEHTYTVQGQDTASKAEYKLNVGEAGAASTPATPGAADAGAAATLTISGPASGASLPGGAFDLKGTGTAGQELEIFEDANSLGKTTVGSDGTWSLNVAAPAAGKHKYEVRAPATGTSAASSVSTDVTVAAATAAAGGATCDQAFTLSLKDGASVSHPFRFGGVGKGSSYTVTVKRGERVVGTKQLPLDASCGWSYTSNPGTGEITYTVAETGGADAGTITLNVQ